MFLSHKKAICTRIIITTPMLTTQPVKGGGGQDTQDVVTLRHHTPRKAGLIPVACA